MSYGDTAAELKLLVDIAEARRKLDEFVGDWRRVVREIEDSLNYGAFPDVTDRIISDAKERVDAQADVLAPLIDKLNELREARKKLREEEIAAARAPVVEARAERDQRSAAARADREQTVKSADASKREEISIARAVASGIVAVSKARADSEVEVHQDLAAKKLEIARTLGDKELALANEQAEAKKAAAEKLKKAIDAVSKSPYAERETAIALAKASYQEEVQDAIAAYNAKYKAASAEAQAEIDMAKAASQARINAIRREKAEIERVAHESAKALIKYEKEQEAQSRGHGGSRASGVGFYVYEIHAVIDEALSGRLHQMQGTLANIGYNILEDTGLFANMSAAALGVAAAGAAAAAAIGVVAYEIHSAKKAMDDLAVSTARVGNAANFRNLPQDMRDVVKIGMAGRSPLWNLWGDRAALDLETLKELIGPVSAVQSASRPLLEAVANLGREIKDIFPSDYQDILKSLPPLFEEPAKGIETLLNQFRNLNPEVAANARAVAESGTASEKYAVIIGLLAEANYRAAAQSAIDEENARNLSDVQKEALRNQQELLNNGQRLTGVEGALSRAFSDKIRIANEDAETMKRLAERVKEVSTSTKDLIDNAAKIAIKENLLPDQLQESINKLKELEKGIDAINNMRLHIQQGMGLSAPLQAGQRQAIGAPPVSGASLGTTSAFAERNAYARQRAAEAGVSPDLITGLALREGGLSGTFGGHEDPDKYGRAGISYGPFQLRKPGLGDEFEASTGLKLGDESTWKEQTDFVVNYIARHGTSKWGAVRDNGGESGLERIGAEWQAKYGAPMSALGSGERRIKDAAEEEIEKQKKILEREKDVRDARAGGNAIQKEDIANLERIVAGTNDDVEAARRKVEAAKSELSELEKVDERTGQKSATEERIASARRTLLQDEVNLKEKIYARDRAAAQLETAKAQTPQQKFEAQKKEFEIERREAGGDKTRLLQIDAQEEAAKKALKQSEINDQIEKENQRYHLAMNGLNNRLALMRTEVQTGRITKQQGYQQELSIEQQRYELERQHWSRIAQLEEQGVSQHRQALMKMKEAEQDFARQRAQIQMQSAQASVEEYKQASQQISSTIASSITGLITGQMKWRDAVRNILTQILNMFLQAKIKMVMDWLLGIGQQTAATVAGQTAQTAAVTAGVAARTAAQQSGSAASMATIIPGILKSIFASAGEAFAGVFGFLSPVMGPAAAGPAAAAQATVIGVGTSLAGALEVGAWEIPHDMPVQVHAGEMVVPAGVTPWARGILAAASQGTAHVQQSLAPLGSAARDLVSLDARPMLIEGRSAAARAAVPNVNVAPPASGNWRLPDALSARPSIQVATPGPSAPAAPQQPTAINVHHSTSFNVSAIDSHGVRQFFRDQGKTIMRTINENIRTGAHLGLSKITA